MKEEHKEKQSFSGAEKFEISHHLEKAKKLVCNTDPYCVSLCKKEKHYLKCNLLNDTAKALAEAEEKGRNESHNWNVSVISKDNETEDTIATALSEAEEKGYNDAFNDIIFRKGIIKKVKGRKYIYFKVAMSDVKKCVQRWKNETK